MVAAATDGTRVCVGSDSQLTLGDARVISARPPISIAWTEAATL